jgi:hypothetical protein
LFACQSDFQGVAHAPDAAAKKQHANPKNAPDEGTGRSPEQTRKQCGATGVHVSVGISTGITFEFKPAARQGYRAGSE